MFGDLGVCKCTIVYTCPLSLLYSSYKICIESLCYTNGTVILNAKTMAFHSQDRLP